MFGLIPHKSEKRLSRLWPAYEPLFGRELAPLMERMFGRWPFLADLPDIPAYGPEIEDTPEAVVVREAVPGFEAKEIEVKISGNLLTVHAEKKEKEGSDTKMWGELHRSVLLPEGAYSEHAEAAYRNGVLEVRLPKLPTARERRIEVKT